VGDFENPEFWDMNGAEEIDGGRLTGGMNSGPSGIGEVLYFKTFIELILN